MPRPVSLFAPSGAPQFLVEQLGGERAADLPPFLNLIIPGDASMPNATDAGVLLYLDKLWQDRAEDDRAYFRTSIVTRYIGVLDFLAAATSALGKTRFDGLSSAEAGETIKRLASDPSQSGNYSSVRNDCLEGYFAHPRWRSGSATEVWPLLHIVPRYPGFMPECDPKNRTTVTECLDRESIKTARP